MKVKILWVLEVSLTYNSFGSMNLSEFLLEEHSKAQCLRVVSWIGKSQQRFDTLMKIFLGEDKKLVQRAAWPFSYAVQAHPPLLNKHLAAVIKKLEQPGLQDAFKRNTVRALEHIFIPERLRGRLMNSCFNFITDIREKPAVKAFSLTILNKLADDYPEIRQELKTIIEERWDMESPAFRSRARKLL